jgi:hypothetical protein
MGYNYTGGKKKFSKIGDEVKVKVWGDEGTLMLVRSNPNKELRFNLDPANGSYICNCRLVLSKSGKGTKVWFEERYTESGSQTKEQLKEQVDELNNMLKKLKSEVEKN